MSQMPTSEPLKPSGTPSIEEKRKKEHEKYYRAYSQIGYGMGVCRKRAAKELLREQHLEGSLLDVGCGRGEMVAFANEIGLDATGVDVVDYILNENTVYGEAYNLPFEDNSFDTVTSFDAFEHFLPEDTESCLKEINRVSRKKVIFTIAMHESKMNGGDNYHINLRPEKEWEKLIKRFIDGKAERMPDQYKARSVTWVITKE